MYIDILLRFNKCSHLHFCAMITVCDHNNVQKQNVLCGCSSYWPFWHGQSQNKVQQTGCWSRPTAGVQCSVSQHDGWAAEGPHHSHGEINPIFRPLHTQTNQNKLMFLINKHGDLHRNQVPTDMILQVRKKPFQNQGNIRKKKKDNGHLAKEVPSIGMRMEVMKETKTKNETKWNLLNVWWKYE